MNRLFGGRLTLLSLVENDRVTQADRPGARDLQAGEATERGGLPAAARAQEHQEFTVLDLEIQIRHCDGGWLPVEATGQS